MSNELSIILSITIYKLVCLFVGTAFSFLGYRLFTLGIWGKAGDVTANFRDTKLVIKSGAPGTFFAVLGAAIVVATVAQGMNFNWEKGQDQLSLTTKPPPIPEAEGASK